MTLKSLHGHGDRVLRRWAEIVIGRPHIMILVSLVSVGLSLVGLGRLRIETSTESFLSRTDPARVTYDEFRYEFGTSDMALVAIETEDVFDRSFLERLDSFHRALEEELPMVSKVTSLLNARSVYGEQDDLVVESLFSEWPADDSEIAVARARALENPLYRNVLLSADAKITTVTVELDAGADIGGPGSGDSSLPALIDTADGERFMKILGDIVARYEAPGFEILLSGRVPITDAILQALKSDMAKLTALAIALAAALLVAIFRRASALVLPLAAVFAVLGTTFGTMGWIGLPVTPASQIIPAFLLAVGIADSVHLLTIFYGNLDEGQDARSALVGAVSHTGVGIVMTSLTTAACLSSFMFTDLAMLVGFGVACAIGVLVALVYTLVLLPPVLVVVPIRARSNSSRRQSAVSVDLLARFGVWCANNRRAVIGAWGIVAAVTFSQAVQLRFEHNPVEWFAPESVARTDVETINERMNMGNFLELVVDSGEEGGLYEPALMQALDGVRERLETRSSSGIVAGRAISVVDVLKETHRALNENRPGEFAVPQARDLIAQELLLFEMSGSNEIDSRVDKPYRKARVTTLLPLADAFELRTYLKETTERLRGILGTSATLTVTGQGHLDVRALTALISSMGKSYVLALVLLVPLMMLLTGDFRLGVLSMVPNMVPIVVGLGLMKAFEIPLDMFTMMNGCIAIGIAVDDTIHFVHNFARNFEKTGDVETAVRQTLRSTGRALFLTSIVLASSFCVFGAASMVSVQGFGIVTAAVIVAAFVADVSLTPALVTFVPRREVRDVRSVRNPSSEGALVSVEARSVSVEPRAS